MWNFFQTQAKTGHVAIDSHLPSVTVAEVVESIQGRERHQRGRVKVGGVLWFALSRYGHRIGAGGTVRIIARDGVYLVVDQLTP